MKVLHIITGLGNGGAEGVLYRLVTHDKNNEHIVISLMDEGKYGPLLIDKGITVYCLNMSPGKPSLESIGKLFKLIKTTEPDIVQTWMYHADLIGGIIAKTLGVKKIFWNVRHSTFDKKHTKASTLRVAKICSIFSHYIPSKIVSCSYVALNPHIELGYAKERFIVINNGYDLDTFKIDKNSRNLTRQSLGLGARPVLGMVGRYDPQKNHRGLIEALAIVKSEGYIFDLVLAGKSLDENNTELVSIIKNSNLEDNVHLLGQRSDIPNIMNALDLHVLSSSYGEGFPNVVAEAMACGTACIATDVGDSSLIIDTYGIIVAPNNKRQLADAVIKMIDKMTNNVRQWESEKIRRSNYIEHNFSIDQMVSKYINLYFSTN